MLRILLHIIHTCHWKGIWPWGASVCLVMTKIPFKGSIETTLEQIPLRITPRCGEKFITWLQERHRHRCLGRTLLGPSHLYDAKCKRRVIHVLCVSGRSGRATSYWSLSPGGLAPQPCSAVLHSVGGLRRPIVLGSLESLG
jgi:hypothetical protein